MPVSREQRQRDEGHDPAADQAVADDRAVDQAEAAVADAEAEAMKERQ